MTNARLRESQEDSIDTSTNKDLLKKIVLSDGVILPSADVSTPEGTYNRIIIEISKHRGVSSMVTSRKIASKAAKQLESSKSKPAQKSVAASALSQSKSSKKSAKAKKR